MNGKGDKRRKKTVDEATWGKNWNMAFDKKQNQGVRVEIMLEDGKKGEGYIVRRHNVDNYEVWCDSQQKTLFLCKEEFKEID
jgi:hypothetical protein